jgi:hypothetical protein
MDNEIKALIAEMDAQAAMDRKETIRFCKKFYSDEMKELLEEFGWLSEHEIAYLINKGIAAPSHITNWLAVAVEKKIRASKGKVLRDGPRFHLPATIAKRLLAYVPLIVDEVSSQISDDDLCTVEERDAELLRRLSKPKSKPPVQPERRRANSKRKSK